LRRVGLALLCLLCVRGVSLSAGAAQPPADSGGTGRPAAQDPNETLERILDQPLYQRWRLRRERQQADAVRAGLVKSVQEMVAHWWRKLADFLNRLLRWMRPSPRPRGGGWGLASVGGLAGLLEYLAWLVIAGLAVFLAVLGFRYVWGRRPARQGARILSREQVGKALQQGEALALDEEEWLAEADRLAAQGNFRAVYRALYLALLSGLHDARKIDFRRNRTNWVYVRRYRGPEEERGAFADLTELFDRAWYGLKPPAGASLAELRSTVDSLIKEPARHG